ncbi:hypothetical protein Z043_117255 [Scleropages formosus]|uniref:Uncharacterized protein n=1 Tax=Scleropages formosus TaxID=113540 RepID=A0A0P7U2E8_SCLFO|nr:hypothetical protein Z043_117255 [Scleropages formosus]
MARKVKQYLSNLQVETDEEKFQIMSLQCETGYSSSSKGLGERRSVKSDVSPVSHRPSIASGKSPQHRMSQVLLAPPVSLYALRKKGTAKDSGPHSASGSARTTPLSSPSRDPFHILSHLLGIIQAKLPGLSCYTLA